MNFSSYKILDKFLDEFEDDSKTIKSDRQIIRNYPKMFVIFAASLFERNIKQKIKNFIDYPLKPIPINYPKINNLVMDSPNNPTDKIFAKLKGYDDKNGVEILKADSFYNLFDNKNFKSSIQTNYNCYIESRKHSVSKQVDALSLLIETSDESKYEEDFAKYSDIKDKLDICTFDIAEKAYLSIKLRRNRVAHNYIDGMSDSLENIRDSFYYYAVLYVLSLEDAVSDLTDISSIPI